MQTVRERLGTDFLLALDEAIGVRLADVEDRTASRLPETRLGQLEAEVAALKDQIATEVRTRRLVVVDGAGRDAIVGETYSRIASLRARRGID